MVNHQDCQDAQKRLPWKGTKGHTGVPGGRSRALRSHEHALQYALQHFQGVQAPCSPECVLYAAGASHSEGRGGYKRAVEHATTGDPVERAQRGIPECLGPSAGGSKGMQCYVSIQADDATNHGETSQKLSNRIQAYYYHHRRTYRGIVVHTMPMWRDFWACLCLPVWCR